MNNKELTTKDGIPGTSDELIACITDDKKRLFLETYHRCNLRTNHTAKAVGVNESTVYRWIQSDVLFSQAFQVLKKELEAVMLDKHLDNLREIAFDKHAPAQTRAMIGFFEVKKLDTAYRDKQEGNQINIREIIVHSAIPWPEYPEIEGEYTEVETSTT